MEALDEKDIGTGCGVDFGALECGLESLACAGVGPGDDHGVLVAAGVNRGVDLLHHFSRADHLLSVEMPAALRGDLVLQLDTSGPSTFQDAHRPGDRDRITEAGVRVDDKGQVDRVRHSGGVHRDFRQ